MREIFRVMFLYEHEHVGIFSNLHWCMFNSTHRQKLFYSVQYKNSWKQRLCCFWSFSYVSQSIKFYTLRIKEYSCFKKVFHQIDRKWMVAPFSNFFGKIRLLFVLIQENAFFYRFHRFLPGIFQIALHFWDRHVFMWQSLNTSNVFNTLTLKQIFLKTKTFFQKTGLPLFTWKY